jgi:hypothetical protein
MPLDLVGANGIPPPYIAHRLKICVSPDVVEIEDGRKSLVSSVNRLKKCPYL